ncbi:pitrilysin family protein [Geothrix sp.]|jgi:predicted Zn-dependent peptidase|uniref:M16 family metallopeptidase n=1 Tax=Geothrix sp. TaxID=1962974 RepID=UPI0025BF24E8|nr:pitrilysin family protein [Geothrix sp.]
MAEPFRTVTPAGTEILIEPLPHVRSCAVGFWVRRGSRHEATSEEGLAHFLEHTVFKGTAAYPTPDELAAATDRLGGHVDAFTGKEVACFYGKVLSDQLPELIHLLGELVTAPRFDGEELVRERSVILEEIAQSEDQPDDWVSELFYGGFWEGTPLAHPILGSREQVSGYGPTEARAFFDHTYRAPNLVVAAAGALEAEPFLALLKPILDRLPRGTDHAPGTLARTRPFLLNVPRKDLQQANLVMGFPAPDHHSPDRAAAHLLSHVLGGGMASRLFMELRERRGLCYQVGSYLSPYADTGALQITASCAPAQLRELVQRTMVECARVRDRGVEADELERAKLQARTSLVFSQESSSSRMFSLAHQAIHHGELRSLDQQMAEIEAVNPADLLRVAQSLLDPAQLGLSALGTRRGCDIRSQDLVA